MIHGPDNRSSIDRINAVTVSIVFSGLSSCTIGVHRGRTSKRWLFRSTRRSRTTPNENWWPARRSRPQVHIQIGRHSRDRRWLVEEWLNHLCDAIITWTEMPDKSSGRCERHATFWDVLHSERRGLLNHRFLLKLILVWTRTDFFCS